MSLHPAVPRSPGARRPRNRRALILVAAADLFHRLGFDRVGMNDIAEAVGITGGGLYRHFASKRELLAETIADALQRFEQVLSAIEDEPLEEAMRKLAAHALDHRELGVLWQRESRHLSGAERDELRRRLRGLAGRVAARVQAERPGVHESDAELLAWSAFAVVASPSHSKVALGRPRFDQLLGELASACLRAELPPGTEAVPAASAGAGSLLAGRVSRREAILDVAVRLFARTGYQSVKLEDIGAAVGIAGASLYNHFASKGDLLEAAVTRAVHWLQMGITRTLATATSAEQAVDEMLRSDIGLALSFGELIDVLISEVQHLPAGQRRRARQAQQEYVAEWVRLLGLRGADVAPVELRITVEAMLTVINDIVRTQHLRGRPALAEALFSICTAIYRRGLARGET